MGITSTKPKGHYVCASLDDKEFLLLLKALQSSGAESLIGRLCAADFPSLVQS